MDNHSENNIIEGLLFHEKWAVEHVYINCFGMCKSYILKNGGQEDDVFDYFQDGLIVLLRNIKRPDFHLSSKVSTYLFAIVRNLWLKRIREEGRLTIVDDSEIFINVSESIAYDDKQEKKLQSIEKGLSLLKEDCRKILKAYYYKQDDLKKIASDLGYTYGFIRLKKVRCMNRMRDILSHELKMITL